MRKITRLAALAFRHEKQFTLGNTTVTVHNFESRGKCVEMRLHGNLIAFRELERDGISKVHVSLAGWGTPTTRERVNGLLDMLGSRAYFYQQKHCQRLSRADSDIALTDDAEFFEIETTC